MKKWQRKGRKSVKTTSSVWLTPEEVENKKKRQKVILYVSLPILAIIISATVTILVNQN